MASNLGVYVSVPVPDIADVLVDFTSIRLYRSATFSGSYTLVTTLTLATGDTTYSYQDANGVLTDWYRYSFYNTSTTDESDLSPPFPASGAVIYTREELRRRVAKELELFGTPWTEYTFPGPSGTTTSTGTNTTAIDSAYVYADAADLTFKGHYLLCTSGNLDGEARIISDYNGSTGTFTVTPAFSEAVASGVTFDIYGEMPPDWWNERLERARLDVWVPFRIAVTGVQNQRTYALPASISMDSQIFGLSRQGGSAIREYTQTPGHDFQVISEDGGTLSLYFDRGLPKDSVWFLEGRRNPPRFIDDDAYLALSDQMLRLFVVTGVQKVCQSFADQTYGASQDVRQWERMAARYEAERRGLVKDIGAFNQQRLARRDPWVYVGTRYDR